MVFSISLLSSPSKRWMWTGEIVQWIKAFALKPDSQDTHSRRKESIPKKQIVLWPSHSCKGVSTSLHTQINKCENHNGFKKADRCVHTHLIKGCTKQTISTTIMNVSKLRNISKIYHKKICLKIYIYSTWFQYYIMYSHIRILLDIPLTYIILLH